MGKVYKVLPQWFKKTDPSKCPFSLWCKKISDDEVLCLVCDKKITCTAKGFAALTQHALTSLHTQNYAEKFNSSQLLLKPREVKKSMNVPSSSASTKATTNNEPTVAKVQLFTSREAATKAELIWVLKSVQCNMAASTTEDLKDVFTAMFQCVPHEFHLGRTKLSYLITEALGPYFRGKLLSDARKSYFTLLYDETTNNADKKELQFMIRFWSEEERQVVCKHLQTVFLGHATAKDIVKKMRSVLSTANLCQNKLLMLSSDGPNVNKKVWNLVNNTLIEERGKGLLDIGTCNLHVVNNAFLKGLQEFGDSACELAIDVYHFFKKFPSRWDDYQCIQGKKNVPKHRFLKHVSSRWLTVAPACERLLEQWPALTEYFLVYIPVDEKRLMKTEKYKNIVKYIKYIDIQVEINFVIESSELFSGFVEFFQRSEPLVHVLYSELNTVLKKISGRICKPDVDANQMIMPEHLLKASKVDCGEKTTVSLQSLKKEKDRLGVMHKLQRHYMISHNYLMKTFLKADIISYCECLQPKVIPQPRSLKLVGELAKSLSFIGVVDIDIKDEWRLLQSKYDIPDTEVRIDHFWRDLLCEKTALGKPKYPSLEKLVKAALCLSHGNADVERGFSLSKSILADNKSNMSLRVLNERLVIRDYMKIFKNVAQVPITRELINLAHSAHKSYEAYLSEQKRLKEKSLKEKRDEEENRERERLRQEEIQNKKQSIEKLETKVKLLAQEKKVTQESADSLLNEANNRLKLAISKGDLHLIRIAQGMLEGAEKLRSKEREHESKEAGLNKIVNKRKANLIDAFVDKKSKRC